MSLQSKFYDPLNQWANVYAGSSEFENIFGPGGFGLPLGQELFHFIGDQFGPRTQVPPVAIPLAPPTPIGEDTIGDSWDEPVPEGFYWCTIRGERRLCQISPEEGWDSVSPPVLDELGPPGSYGVVPEEYRVERRPIEVGKAEETVIDPTDETPVDDEGDEEMPIDWGDLIGDIAGDWLNPSPVYNPPGYGGPVVTPLPGPRVVNPPGFTTGGSMAVYNRCKPRRRRRRLLTEGDFNDLMRIATLPNNTNVRTALAKAVGRR